MLKILLTIALLCVEVILFYKFNRITAYPARFLLYSYLIYWYCTERKKLAVWNRADKIFILSLAISVLAPFPGFIWDTVSTKVAEVLMLMGSHLLIALIWFTEGARIDFSNQRNTLAKIMVPYILLPVLFFCFVVLPTYQLIPIVLYAFYLLLVICIATLSAFVPYNEKSKFYISMAMSLLIIASGANFLRLCVSPYEYDFAFVRFTSVAFRVFLLLGLLYRETHKTEPAYLA